MMEAQAQEAPRKKSSRGERMRNQIKRQAARIAELEAQLASLQNLGRSFLTDKYGIQLNGD